MSKTLPRTAVAMFTSAAPAAIVPAGGMCILASPARATSGCLKRIWAAAITAIAAPFAMASAMLTQVTEEDTYERLTLVRSEQDDGSVHWYNSLGQVHRVHGPAVELADGTKVWFLNGYRHRTNGPAFEYADGSRAWYRIGKLHREDGPAVEWYDGTTEWWLNGKLTGARRHESD